MGTTTMTKNERDDLLVTVEHEGLDERAVQVKVTARRVDPLADPKSAEVKLVGETFSVGRAFPRLPPPAGGVEAPPSPAGVVAVPSPAGGVPAPPPPGGLPPSPPRHDTSTNARISHPKRRT